MEKWSLLHPERGSLGDLALPPHRPLLSIEPDALLLLASDELDDFHGPARLGDAVLDAVLARTEVPPGYTIKQAEGFRFRAEDRR